MLQLRSVSKKKLPAALEKKFPFNTSVIKHLEDLKFTSPVTFFVGENGAGKSTLLEGIAAACRVPIVGSRNIDQDKTMSSATILAQHLQLSWSVKTNKGFFLRAEDFFGFTKRLNRLRSELLQEIERLDKELPDGYGKDLAIGSIKGQIEELTQRYGVDLNASSHGEGFLQLFQSRMKANSLYLLDEPETPLSPTRQLSLLKLISDQVKQNSQFIIATHSPILMAYPSAVILDFNHFPAKHIEYSNVDHVQITRDFITHKEKYLKELGIN